VAGLTMGIAAPFLTNTINYYVSNKKIKIGKPNSLFFITDGGSIQDGAFNEAAYDAVTAIGGKFNYESPLNSNFSTLIHAYNLAVYRGATILELNGFLHEQALKQFSYENPNIGIIYLDSKLSIKNPQKPGVQQGNVASITFKTEQVGYLAGFAAAA
jgi:basic membrane lipoprotein Med (substrate-binding protein (PBP1-ABC) superfamily)